ncbi:MAG: tetratricopeptide repeat protein [bacterium]
MRPFPAVLLAGVLWLSSPISTFAAPPEEPPDHPGEPRSGPREDLPERKTVEGKTDVTPLAPRQFREMVGAGDLSGALERVRKEIARGGHDPKELGSLHLLEARLLDRLGRGAEAVPVYRDLLADSTVHGTARMELHDLYVGRGQFRLADRLTDPEDSAGTPLSAADAARLRAYSWSVQGRFAAAESLAAGPAKAGDARAAVLRANALLALGKKDDATAIFVDVLRTDAPRDALQIAHYGLGQIARLAGARAVRALEDEKAIHLGPMPAAELDYGLALRALGRRDDARTRLGGVVTDYPSLAPTARLVLARLDEEDGKSEPAVDALAAATGGGFGDFLALTRLGDALHARGDENPAIEAYQHALEIFPEFPPARERLTAALTAQGRWQEVPAATDSAAYALQGWVWERLLDGDLPYQELVAERDSIPIADPRRLVLALVELRAGFPAGAVAWSEGVAADHPLLAEVRAEALEHVGRTDEAVDLWSAVLQGHESALAREGIARVAARAKKKDDAVAAWQELFKRHPTEPRAERRLAREFEAAGWTKEAKEAYERALSAGWLTPDERRAAREAAEDLTDQLREQDETHAES